MFHKNEKKITKTAKQLKVKIKKLMATGTNKYYQILRRVF